MNQAAIAVLGIYVNDVLKELQQSAGPVAVLNIQIPLTAAMLVPPEGQDRRPHIVTEIAKLFQRAHEYRGIEQPPPKPLNHDHDVARAVHRIVRGMHDGECPKCHTLNPSEVMPWPCTGSNMTSHRCPQCGFEITKAESAAAIAAFGPFMDNNREVFEQWRANLPK